MEHIGQVCGGLSEGQGCGMYRGVLWSPWVPREAGRHPAHLDGSDPRMAQALQAQGLALLYTPVRACLLQMGGQHWPGTAAAMRRTVAHMSPTLGQSSQKLCVHAQKAKASGGNSAQVRPGTPHGAAEPEREEAQTAGGEARRLQPSVGSSALHVQLQRTEGPDSTGLGAGLLS